MKTKSRIKWPIFVSVSLIWLMAPLVLAVVVYYNAERGVYGHSDAILIPIFNAVYLCAIGVPYFIFFAVSASSRYSTRLSIWHFRSTLRHWIILMLSLFGLFVLSSEILYWGNFAHAPIVLSYSAAAVWIIWMRPFVGSSRLAPPQAEQDGAVRASR